MAADGGQLRAPDQPTATPVGREQLTLAEVDSLIRTHQGRIMALTRQVESLIALREELRAFGAVDVGELPAAGRERHRDTIDEAEATTHDGAPHQSVPSSRRSARCAARPSGLTPATPVSHAREG